MGLGQRFAETTTRVWGSNDIGTASKVQITRAICGSAYKDFQSTGAPAGQFGALLAFPCSGQAELCEFAVQDLQPELKTDAMWYVSMGSGQPLADPYLRLMRSIFWEKGPPSLTSARFVAMWVLRHSIVGAPGFIGNPIRMAVLERGAGGQFEARMLSKTDLEEHEGA